MLDWVTASPLCRFSYKEKIDDCWIHSRQSRVPSERDILLWTRRGYSCRCENPWHRFFQVCVSVLGSPAVRKPTDAVYVINVLHGTCRENNLDAILHGEYTGTDEIEETRGYYPMYYRENISRKEFTLYDTLDESEDLQRALVRDHLSDLLEGLRQAPSDYRPRQFLFQRFSNFRACTGQDKYIASFLELLAKLEKPCIPQEPKDCAHTSRRLKQCIYTGL